jgi:hypothetical protein
MFVIFLWYQINGEGIMRELIREIFFRLVALAGKALGKKSLGIKIEGE